MDRYLLVEDVSSDVAEVEFDGGLRTELPAAWLGEGVAEGDGFRIEHRIEDGGATLRFVPDPRAARVIRERNKGTLLEFADRHDHDETAPDQTAEDGPE